jgi:hypothetical protein
MMREKIKNFKEKKMEDEKKSCCYECFKAIFMAIVLLAIGAIFGYGAAMRHCRLMMGPWGGHHMKACWERCEREREGGWENKCIEERGVCGKEKGGWFGHKKDVEESKPCPMKGADLPEPEKGSYPMMKEGKPGKAKPKGELYN